MDYKTVFTYHDKEYHDTKYTLKDYDYILKKYDPKKLNFEEDFYLRVFLRKLVFELDIVEIETFLEFQFDSSKLPSKFVKILDLKIVPAMQEIIEEAQFNSLGRGYYKEDKLIDGFVKTEGIIKHWDFDFAQFPHLVEVKGLKNDLEKRIVLVKGFLKEVLSDNAQGTKLNWIGNDSQLAIIVRELVDQNFIEAPKQKNGEVNVTELCRQIKHSFINQKGLNIDTIRRYVSPNDDKHQELNKKFKEEGFHIPDRQILS